MPLHSGFRIASNRPPSPLFELFLTVPCISLLRGICCCRVSVHPVHHRLGHSAAPVRVIGKWAWGRTFPGEGDRLLLRHSSAFVLEGMRCALSLSLSLLALFHFDWRWPPVSEQARLPF